MNRPWMTWLMCAALCAPAVPARAASDPTVRATVLEGQPPTPPPRRPPPGPGDITLNFPGADVQDVVRAVLGEMLRTPYAISPGLHGPVTLVTAQPVARSQVMGLLEDALKAANFALVSTDAGLSVAPLASAMAQPPGAAGAAGFANEIIALKFVGADEMKRLLDPIVPGSITQTDPTRNAITVSGTSRQRQSIRDLVAQFDVDWLRGMSFALIIPQRTDSRLITPELERLLNAPGAGTAGMVRLVAMDRLNGILAVSAQRQYLDDVRRFVEILDREGESSQPRFYVYRVQNGRSADLARVLTVALNGGSGSTPAAAPSTSVGGSAPVTPAPSVQTPPPPASVQDAAAPGSGATITSDETNNAVVVFGTPREYAVIEDALRQLDVPPLQVMIEAAITEVTLNGRLRFGLQTLFTRDQAQFGFSQGNSATPQQAFPGFSYLYNRSGPNAINAVLNALQNVTHVEVLSAPKILVLNNTTASLQVGDQVPVATESAVSTTVSNAPIVNSITYRDTGVILKVTPRVNSGGLVLLDISQEVSDVARTGSSTIDSPTIQTRRFASSIAVQDGQTIALGGLMRDNRNRNQTGVPGLSQIPVVGALFGEQSRDRDRTELLILLTPTVVRTAEDAQTVTDELREKIRTIRPYAPARAPRP